MFRNLDFGSVFVIVGKQKTNATFVKLKIKDVCVAWCGASSPLPSVLGSYNFCFAFMLERIQKADQMELYLGPGALTAREGRCESHLSSAEKMFHGASIGYHICQ